MLPLYAIGVLLSMAGGCDGLIYCVGMTVEGEPHSEVIRPGQLYFLAHPASELFSGYGLTTHEGRKDRLVGLLMVDRPHPVNQMWLSEIEHRYGDYQLLPMSATGERGLLAQMRIAVSSLVHLDRRELPVAAQLRQALQPLLEELPAPILKLNWDKETALWRSDFWIGLPAEMQAVFEKTRYGCFAAERADNTVSFISHAADSDIERFQCAPVLWRWELITMPTAPLIRFRAAILDAPGNPYIFEHFLNLDEPEQGHCLATLVNQEDLTFDFYGHDYEYAYSKTIPHPAVSRQDLQEIVRRAVDYYGTIPPEKRDFDRAKAIFQRAFPL